MIHIFRDIVLKFNMETKKFKLKIKKKTLVLVDWANVYGWQKNLGWEVDPKKLFLYLNRSTIIGRRFYYGVEIGQQKSEDFKKEIESIGYTAIFKEVKWTPILLEKQSHLKKIVKELFDVLDSIKNVNTEISNRLFELKQKIEDRLAEGEPDFDRDGSVQGITPAYNHEDGILYDEAYNLIEELDSELQKLNINIANLQNNLSQPILRRKCDFDVEIAMDALNAFDDYETLLLFSGDGDYAALANDLIKKGKKVILVFGPGCKGREYLEINNCLFYECSVDKLKGILQK